MIEQICQECGHRLSFPNQYAGTARSCHFCGAIVSLPETLPPSARVPNAAQKSVRMKRATGPFGLDRNYLVFAGVFFGFSLLLCITGFLAGGTGEPFSITVFVLGFVVLVTSAAGTIMAVYDVDILSEWTRSSFTLGNALLLFLPCGALGALTTVFTYSP